MMKCDLMATATKATVPWVTKDEIGFLRRIGKWAIRDRSQNYAERRRTLFERYCVSMKLRKQWNGIDREAVEKYLLRKK